MKSSDAGLLNELLIMCFCFTFTFSASAQEGQQPTHHLGAYTHAEEFGGLQKLGKPIRSFVSFLFWENQISLHSSITRHGTQHLIGLLTDDLTKNKLIIKRQKRLDERRLACHLVYLEISCASPQRLFFFFLQNLDDLLERTVDR